MAPSRGIEPPSTGRQPVRLTRDVREQFSQDSPRERSRPFEEERHLCLYGDEPASLRPETERLGGHRPPWMVTRGVRYAPISQISLRALCDSSADMPTDRFKLLVGAPPGIRTRITWLKRPVDFTLSERGLDLQYHLPPSLHSADGHFPWVGNQRTN